MPTATCGCGHIRIELTGDIVSSVRHATASPTSTLPLNPTPSIKQALCHCTNCKVRTSTLFSTNIIIPKANFTLLQGEARIRGVTSWCGDCGTTLWSEPVALKDMMVIKAGILGEDCAKLVPKPTDELFVKHRPEWLLPIEGAKQHRELW